jgi:O-antigen/teichoic acid export membrane protein
MISKQDKTNAFWNSSTFIFLSLAGFINFSLTLKTYTPEIFGLYILMTSIFGLGYTFDLGFGAATIRQLAIAKKENDSDLIRRFFFTFMVTYFVIAILITVLISGYYLLFLANSEIVNSVKNINTTLVFIFISSTYFFKYINNYFKNIFEGFSEFVILSKILIIVTILNTLFILILFIFKLEIVYLALFTFIVQLFSTLMMFFRLIYSYKNLSLSANNFDYSLIKKYMLYGFNIQLASFVNGLIDPIVKMLIGSFLSLSFVTFYETSKKIIDLSNGLIFSAQKGLFNKLSEQHSSGGLDDYINNNLFYYSKMSNYYSILVYGLLNPFICFGMFLWFKNYESVIILLIFFIPYSLINYGGALYTVIMVDGKGMKLVLIQAINLATTILFLYLSLFYSKSYLGLSAFYLSIIVNTFVIFSLLKKSNNLQYRVYIKKTLLSDIVILNIILVTQTILMFLFADHYIYILILFLIVYNIVFYKYVKYFINLFIDKIFKERFKLKNV